MEKTKLKAKLESLLKEACLHLAELVKRDNNVSNIHTYIPKQEGQYRISEQELKSIFLELLCTKADMTEYKFSLETPTVKKYTFSNSSEKTTPIYGIGKSANIDVSILNKNRVVAIIEFKAKNTDDHSHAKDFIKLREEPGVDLIRFFVEVYVSTNAETLQNIHKKLYKNQYGNIGDNTSFIGFSMNHNNMGCKFFICDMNGAHIE